MKAVFAFIVVVLICFEGSDASCGCEYAYKKVGCYYDVINDRALPEMLANERDQHSQHFNGHLLNWFDWINYMPEMVCRCAEQAFKEGYKYFGLQFWGECWSGSDLQAQFDKHGEGDACYGPTFQKCDLHDKNCVGDNFHNFVYEIATYTCDVNFEKIGCYNDYDQDNDHILSARSPGSDIYLGHPIDWWNYDVFLPKFACECAKKTAEKGFSKFGLQYYGECWTGQKFEDNEYLENGEANCINKCFGKCKRWNRFCIGEECENAVYRITHPDCEMKYESLGCYNAVDAYNNNSAMPELLLNEISPASDKFYGYMLEFDESWETLYLQLLCRCARAADDKGYTNFAIRNKGECWSGPNSGESYDLYGDADTCIRKESDPCEDDIKCAGDENSFNVYKLLPNTIVIGKK